MDPNITADMRKQNLANAVRRRVASGWRVEANSDYQAIVVKGKRPNHTLHLLISVLTATIWAFVVWLPLALFKHEKRRIIEVDAAGSITDKRA